jgi:hypothetical protein
MRRLLMMLGLVLQITTLSAAPLHFTFFGDSFTDTGNFPEASNVSDPVLKNFSLYVPVSNPVLLKAQDPMFHFLERSLGPLSELGQINGQARAHYSVNWPLYLMYSFSHHSPKALISWSKMATDSSHDAQSVNYAWASALAGNSKGDKEMDGECFHVNGQPFLGDCQASSLLAFRKEYQVQTAKNPNFDKDQDYDYQTLQIPDLNKQVALYLYDFRNRLPSQNALFIYIGANDIAHFMKSHLIKAAFYKEDYFIANSSQPQMEIVASYVDQAVGQIEAAYGSNKNYHIYVLSLPHLSNLYEAYAYKEIPFIGSKFIQILDRTVDEYNADLSTQFQKDSQVSFLDSGSKMNQWAASSLFKDSVVNGKACSKDPHYLMSSAINTTNCYYEQEGMTKIYFSWNNAHFTAPVNQRLATAVALGIKT